MVKGGAKALLLAQRIFMKLKYMISVSLVMSFLAFNIPAHARVSIERGEFYKASDLKKDDNKDSKQDECNKHCADPKSYPKHQCPMSMGTHSQ